MTKAQAFQPLKRRGRPPQKLTTGPTREFGLALKRARGKLKQVDVAKRIGITRRLLSEAENGQFPLSREHIEKFAAVCEADRNRLLVLGGYPDGELALPIHRIQWAFHLLLSDPDYAGVQIRLEDPPNGPHRRAHRGLVDQIIQFPVTSTCLVLLWGRKTGRQLFSHSELKTIIEWLGCDARGYQGSLEPAELKREFFKVARKHFSGDKEARLRFYNTITNFVRLKPLEIEYSITTFKKLDSANTSEVTDDDFVVPRVSDDDFA